jgi:hypothetical protein
MLFLFLSVLKMSIERIICFSGSRRKFLLQKKYPVNVATAFVARSSKREKCNSSCCRKNLAQKMQQQPFRV